MNTARLLAIILIVAVMAACSQQGTQKTQYTSDLLAEKIEAAADDAAKVNICEDFMTNAADIEVKRNAQTMWYRLDPVGMQVFVDDMLAEHSQSAEWIYLAARFIDDPIAQIEAGREAISLNPNFAEGYRLITATYSQDLFRSPTGEYAGKLTSMLQTDAPHFQKYADLAPEEPIAHQFLYDYYVHTGQTDEALTVLGNAEEKAFDWVDGFKYATVHARAGDFAKAMETVEKEVAVRIEAGRIGEEDKNDYIDRSYQSVLRNAAAYDHIVAYIKKKPGSDKDPEQLYAIAYNYALAGDKDNAFASLNKATMHGWDQVIVTKQDQDLNELHDDPRWEAVIRKIEANWDKGKPERKKAALAEKIERPAPEFTLEDVDGHMVSLADQKGKVVVLDFWATWCGPCRMAMPLIDDFVENHADENVVVYSINVWEESKSKPQEFMEDNEYDMTLLYGNDDLAKAYGVQGIPYLCVIDQQGVIRYEEKKGFHQGITENLEWWTEDLLTRQMTQKN